MNNRVVDTGTHDQTDKPSPDLACGTCMASDFNPNFNPHGLTHLTTWKDIYPTPATVFLLASWRQTAFHAN